jgi:tRNA-splicing ligase RtcB
LDRDASGDVWLLIHCGSRGLGAAVGGHHVKSSAALDFEEIPGLSADSDEGRACIADIRWALSFAAANRRALQSAAAEIVATEIGMGPVPSSVIDVHHNFVELEEHLERRIWVHRKGAIAALPGTRVLIPGSTSGRT